LSPRSWGRWARWGALALAASGVARADEPGAAPPGEPGPARTEEILVEGPRLAAPRDRTAAATVVEADRFAGESKDVAALVATAPGVAVQEYGGLGQLATVSIRGATADGVKVLLDGLPLNAAAGGGVDLSTIPAAWVERIEVVRGAEGARYGAGALGGVVNVVTRRAAPGAWSAQVAGGSFATGSGGADAAFGGESWGSLLAVTGGGTSGRFPYRWDLTPSGPTRFWLPSTRSNNGAGSGGLLAKGWAGAGGGRVDWLAQLSGGSRGLPGLPGSETPEDSMREARLLASARWLRPLRETLQLALQAEGRGEGLDVDMRALGGAVRQREGAGAARAEVRWSAGAHLVAAGASVGGDRLEADGLGGPRSRAELAAWLSDGLRIAPALRAERLGAFAGLSAKLGASAALGGPLSARASAGRTFRAPSFAELYLEQGLLRPNPDLRPETGTSADAALAAEGELGLASLGAFASLYDDLIVYVPASFDRLAPQNDARALVRGLEAEVASAPLGPLGASLSLSWTLLRAETLRGTPAEIHRDVPHRARQRLYARVGLAPGAWEAHAEVHCVGRQWNDPSNLEPIRAALAVNAGGSVRLWRAPAIWLHLEVKNLADDRTLQDGYGNPLPGRMAMLALRAASDGEGGRR
jgi:iron complex outermembrane receptor protein